MNAGPSPPSAATIRPSGHREPGRVHADPERGDARRDHGALAIRRRDEPLAAGQVPERARRPELAVVGDPGPAVERKLEVGAPRARDPRARPRVEQRRHGLGPRRHRVEVDRHHAGEHVLGDAGHRSATSSLIRGALARARVAQRPAGGRDEHVARRQRRRHRFRGLGAVGGALVHDDQHRVGAGRRGFIAQRVADRPRRPIDHHHDVLALLDREAPSHHGLDCRPKVAHRRLDHMGAASRTAPAPCGLHSRARRSSSVG